MTLTRIAVFTALTFLGFAAFAQEAEMERPSMSSSRTMNVTAVVEAIDYETREVTVRRTDDTKITFTASEEARNLEQVAVGDILQAEYVESLSIQVFPNEGFEPDAAVAQAVARTKEGQMPGFAAMERTVVTATIEEINLETNTFKLKEADGSINEYVARVPSNLKRVMVGDLVVIIVTGAVAIVVEEQPAE